LQLEPNFQAGGEFGFFAEPAGKFFPIRKNCRIASTFTGRNADLTDTAGFFDRNRARLT